MSYVYDVEAVFQDADIEMAEGAIIGDAIAARQRQGICCHGGAVAYRVPAVYPEQIGLEPGQYRCTDGCGTVFDSEDDWLSAMAEAIGY